MSLDLSASCARIVSMTSNPLILSHELEQAVIGCPDGALKVIGTSGSYWVLTDTAMQIRREVQKGLDQADSSDVASWDAAEINREGRRLRLERSKDA